MQPAPAPLASPSSTMEPSDIHRKVYFASLVCTLLYVFVSFLRQPAQSKHQKSPVIRRNVIRRNILRLLGLSLISASYVLETVVDNYNVVDGAAQGAEEHAIHTVVFALIWLSIACRSTYLPKAMTFLFLLSLAFSVPLLLLSIKSRVWNRDLALLVAIQASRMAALLGLLADFAHHWLRLEQKHHTEEASPLLTHGSDDETLSPQTAYGTGPLPSRERHSSLKDDSDSGSDSDDDDDEDTKFHKSASWLDYLKNFKILLPYLIPRNDLKVQAAVALCLLCLTADRFLNILVPRQLGIVTDKLSAGKPPMFELAIWFVLSTLHGVSGLGLLEDLAKIPIKQFSYRQITNVAFNHVMSLGMEFHSDKDSAEVMKAIEQGEALTNSLETAFLEIVPTVVDLVVAFVVLYTKFSSSVAICMCFASICFISLQIVTSRWNFDNRRRQTKSDREQARVMHQAVQGWKTVSDFNMFGFEKTRFSSTVETHLSAQRDWTKRDAYTTALLELLVPTTFFSLMYLVILDISRGRATAGDFVFLLTYWDNLIWPLKYLMHDYRWLISSLIDAERLLDLLTTNPTIVDKDNAQYLRQVEGLVEFEHVGFAYNKGEPIIKDFTVSVKPGNTVALVGSSGAGKSSIIKLLMRFYDISSGSITIDGHDIRNVVLGSLRDNIGVVPQDPLLFNASIMENLRYARTSASDEEIYDACRAASIHDQIISFPRGYETKVGEQGVKLSGGEVQRLAIARIFLKDPPILILDEATSAVDTHTESIIQESLKHLSTRRTTFIIAHRLSTVVEADQILVMDKGTIAESGTHAELLERKGRYHELWKKQLG